MKPGKTVGGRFSPLLSNKLWEVLLNFSVRLITVLQGQGGAAGIVIWLCVLQHMQLCISL